MSSTGDRLRGSARDDQVALDGAERAYLLDRLELAAPGMEVVHRLSHFVVDLNVPIFERDNALSVLDRERRVQLGVDHREEGGADADPDGQPQSADDREARVLRQHSRAKLEVNARIVQPTKAARVALMLLRLFNAAEGAPRGQASIRPGHAVCHEVVFEQLEMGNDFARQLRFRPVRTDERQQPVQKTTHGGSVRHAPLGCQVKDGCSLVSIGGAVADRGFLRSSRGAG